MITGFPDTLAPVGPIESPSGIAWFGKRAVERVTALIVLMLAAPAFLVIAAAIRLDSRGPVFFVQPRFGKDGKPFNMLKFRTMRFDDCDVSGAGQTADHDLRVTRLGLFLRRSSIDELPQIINVLRGQMALIGPRAHPCGMRVQGFLCEEVDPRYHLRHRVCPGITGWAQVNGSRGAVKSASALSNRVSLDIDYIQNWSLRRDLTVFLRTFAILIHSDRGCV